MGKNSIINSYIKKIERSNNWRVWIQDNKTIKLTLTIKE